ncbi:MAG: glycosyltransferase, partial [Pseudomonadota bacterium]
MSKPKVLHLIDDTTAGGVTRVVDHVVTSPELAQNANHHLRVIDGIRADVRCPWADVIVSHLSVNWRNLPLLLALKLGNPQARLIHVEHSYTEAFVRLNVQRKARFYLLLKVAYRLFDKVAAVSQAQLEWLSRIGAVGARRLTLIRSFVNLSDFEALNPAKGSIRVIGAIGRLEHQKGFDNLIRDFRKSNRSDLELHIYGTGSEKETLKALAQNDSRIVFKGFAK